MNGDKVISREEFIGLMKNLKMEFSSTELNAIWLQLDKSNNGKAYALNFKTLFLGLIDQDLKGLIVDLYRSLDNEEIGFAELMKRFTKNAYIAFPKLQDAIKSISTILSFCFNFIFFLNLKKFTLFHFI